MLTERSSRSSWQRYLFVVAVALAGLSTATAVRAQDVETLSNDPVVAAQKHVATLRLDYESQTATPVQVSETDRETLLATLRVLVQKNESLALRAVDQSVTATARCAEGYVLQGRAGPIGTDAQLVSETRVDCSVEGCRAFQVTAEAKTPVPFDLDVSVTCGN